MSEPIRSLKELEPETAARVGEWLRLCGAKGVPVLIIESYRSPERQDELYARGRTDAGKIVTNARAWQSFHQYRLAIDAVPYEALIEGGTVSSKLDWSPFRPGGEQAFRQSLEHSGGGDVSWLDQRWGVMVAAAAEVGLAWAGRWHSLIEYVHFQRADAPTIEALQRQRQAGAVAP